MCKPDEENFRILMRSIKKNPLKCEKIYLVFWLGGSALQRY